jgi:hypothetical protein
MVSRRPTPFRLAACLCLLPLVLLGCGSSTYLDGKALAKEADTVRSNAAEAALLAEDSAAGKATSVYRRVHASYLEGAEKTLAATLAKSQASPAVTTQLKALARLAEKVDEETKQLESASSRSEQQRLGEQLKADAAAAAKLGRQASA